MIFVSFFSLLIIVKYYVLFHLNHITRTLTHTHTHTHTEKRDDPVLHQFNIRQENEENDNNDIVLVMFPFFVNTPTHKHKIHWQEKKRIICCTYYTIHNTGGTLFYCEIYSYQPSLFLSFFIILKSYNNSLLVIVLFFFLRHIR